MLKTVTLLVLVLSVSAILQFDDGKSFLAFAVDTAAPVVAITSPANNAQVNNSQPTIQGTSSDSGSGVQKVQVRIDGGAYTIATGTTSWSYTPSILSSGSHTVTAKATDNSGNVATTSITIIVDTTSPAVAIASPANNTQINNNKPTIQGTSSDSGSGVQKVQVSIDGGAHTTATGTTSWSYTPSTALSSGSHTVTARATDKANNVSIIYSVTFTVDRAAPVVAITSPANNTQVNSSQPTIQGTSFDSGSGVQQVQVSIDGGAYTIANGTISWSYTLSIALSSGSHTVTAKATDNAGNTATTSSITFTTIDTIAPAVAITSPANNTQISSKPVIQGTSSDSGSGVRKVQVSIDGSAYTIATGTTSWSYTPSILSSGSHIVTAKATDNSGNVATTSITIIVDTTSPAVAIASPVNNTQINNSQPTIQGTSSDSGSGVQQVQVSIDGGAYTLATGTTSWSYTPSTALSLGPHTVTAKATDNVGNTATTSSIKFTTIDTTAPVVAITSPANNDQVSNKPTIQGTSSDSGSGVQKVQVSIDGGTYTLATGTTSWSYTPSTALSLGSHTVTAKATDNVGNTATTSSIKFTIDITAPVVAITSPANNDQVSNKPTIQGTSSDSGSGVQQVQVSIDGGAYTIANGTTSWSYTPSTALSSGSHKITAKATDNAGNTATTSSIKFTVDTTDPKITMTSPANNTQVSNQPTMQGTSFDSGSGVQKVQVSIDGSAYTIANGTTSWSYTPSTALSLGPHTVTAKATDNAGNVATTSTITIIVDTTAPAVAITSPENNTQVNNNQPIIQGTSSDSGSGVQQVQVSIDGSTYTLATGTTSWSYIPLTKLSSAPHTITARATDNTGNVATTSSVTFTVYITAPSAPLNLQATGSNTQVSLTWQQAPSSNGGDAITNYKIYRSLASGNEVLLTTVGNVTSYNNTGLTNGVTYYYKVSSVNSVGESPQSKETSASPSLIPVRNKTIIFLMRPDLDSTSFADVASYAKSFSRSTDFVFDGGITGYTPNWTVMASIPGYTMIGGGNNESTTDFYPNWQYAQAQHNASAVFFDEEPTLSMTNVTIGYTITQSLGIKFVPSPTYGEIIADPTVITTLAQNSDIINFDINPAGHYRGADKGMTYAQVVQKYELAARQTNPNIQIFVQLNAGTSTNHTNIGDMTDQINAFNSVKNYVDGVIVFYYSTPDPTPILKLFYKGTGLVS